MANAIEVRVPNIGDFKDIAVIDVLVKPGDAVKVDDPLVTLESDKAAMDVPSPAEGIVEAVTIKVGDKVSEGSAVLTLSGAGAAAASTPASTPAASAPAAAAAAAGASAAPAASTTASSSAPPAAGAPPPAAASAGAIGAPPAGATTAAETRVEVRVPDIGDFKDVPVVDVVVKAGDMVEREGPLVVLESDKAALEIPSTESGRVESIAVSIGDKVSQGTLIATLLVAGSSAVSGAVSPGNGANSNVTNSNGATANGAATSGSTSNGAPSNGAASNAGSPGAPAIAPAAPAPAAAPATAAAPASAPPAPVISESSASSEPGANVHASPSIRRFARELGVPLAAVRGSGPSGRITREDVQAFVKRALAAPAAPAAGGSMPFDLPPWPKPDFAQFGPIEDRPLTRIQKLSGPYLQRNWITIPHVTNNEEADITELEALRQKVNAENPDAKLTILAFLIKACAAALIKFPDFNSSLDGDKLILKKYYNVGFAADTPGGLVVPVLKKADTKGVLAIASETRALASKAREGKLGPADMAGGTFTISSLGGIGGTSFTPIVNAPEVAILGVSRSALRPVWNGRKFAPRLMLPLSLSYDHRVIDGAAAARFNVFLANLLADMRLAVL